MMKKYMLFILTLVLTAALFTGCGCTGRNTPTMPTTLPTETTMPTMPSTQESTLTTTAATTEATTESTADRGGNGPTDNGSTAATEDTAAADGARSRQASPTTR